MKIRFANIEDLSEIVTIYNQAITAGYKTADLKVYNVDQRIDWFNQHPPEKYPIFVALQNDVIAGYLFLSAYRPGREAFAKTAEVSFFVDKQYHGKNIGTALVQHIIDYCPTLDIRTLIAMLIEGNQESIGLVKKFGFEKWGYLPNIAVFDGNETGHLYYGLRIS